MTRLTDSVAVPQYVARTAYQGHTAAEYDRLRTRSFVGRLEWSRETSVVTRLLHVHAKRNSTILDAPTGTGRFLPLLEELGYFPAGLDISQDMLRLAKGRSKHSAVLFQGECERLPLRTASVDYILSMRYMGHVPPSVRVNVLLEFRRVARRGAFVGFPVLDPITWTKCTLGNVKHRLIKGARRSWWPATPDRLSLELRNSGWTLVQAQRICWPLSHISLLYLEPRT